MNASTHSHPLPTPILPPAMLGILGGGQLGRMFTVAAKTMGYQVTVLDPDPLAPASEFADVHLCQPYDDAHALQHLAHHCAAVTTEFENVNAESMTWLAQFIPVSPSGRCVAIAQNRIEEKAWIRRAGLDTAPYLAVESLDALHTDLSPFLPGILKTARLGYDGKGQIRVQSADDVFRAFEQLGHTACVLEKCLDLACEVSVIVTRLNAEHIDCYPVGENQHVNGILDATLVPARIDPVLQDRARSMAMQLAHALDYVGVLAVEFFVLQDGALIVNEIAPRPHNSGHYTLDACPTNQFQQQVRVLCHLPPARCQLTSPSVMINLLGDSWFSETQPPNWTNILQYHSAYLHLYGKKTARIGRKMGHYTVLAANVDAAYQCAKHLQQTLSHTHATLDDASSH